MEAALVRTAPGLKLPDAAIVAAGRLARAGRLISLVVTGARGVTVPRRGALAPIGNDRQWRTRRLGVACQHSDDVLALS